ncbi:aspartate aminotransferase family protein [Yersinia intermedia]|uniref:aspartate aminotransferase family protein n=1 Tax=Yersinia intermedia TaxID=631 RepID=UPI0030CD3A3E
MMNINAHLQMGRSFTQSEVYRKEVAGYLTKSVSSHPRASQLPVPLVIERAEGALLTDIDGNDYIDFTLGYGPLILGHNPIEVMTALKAELDRGLRTASVHRGEGALAKMIAELVPSAELTSFLSSGTEAVQLALRVARAVTGKTQVIKFRANYHGWFDSVHIANNYDQDGPTSEGQDPLAAISMTVIDWGDVAALKETLTTDFAAVILEPVAINAGCFAPIPKFLEEVRLLTHQLGVMLIFDEVVTGFRLGLGGAQQKYGVTPDITVLGKALGNGLPISAVTGSVTAMQPLIDGRILHRGTFNGNPLSVAASIACLETLQREAEQLYPRIDGFAAGLREHINEEACRQGVAICANQVGSALQIFTGIEQVATINDSRRADKTLTLQFTAELVRLGINPLPRGLMYISAAHTEKQIAMTMQAISGAMKNFRQRIGE